ncbi:co-chaperone GroES [Helicobacter enhydrae]|uniref:Co-chaperonin GroES n=1 Tax=Helicobacter enhydrae TaxID=222136 RepID=A0A1B1U620_9HELI|nr:co-chaperone GroES [Helicobacter enhydrae]
MNFKPLGKRILVERLEEDTKTSSGIIIPDNAKEKPLMGKIVAVSKEIEEECKCVALNQVVVFGKYKGSEIKLEGKEYIVLEIEDVLGIIA